MADNLNHIEELKKRLFMAKDEKSIPELREHTLHNPRYQVAKKWTKETINTTTKIMSHGSLFKKFFIGSLVLLLASFGFFAYMFLQGNNTVSNDNIDIAILGNAFAKGGEQLPIQVSITNKNKSSISSVDLVLSYPKGSGTDDTSEYIRLRKTIGTIESGQTKTEPYNLVLYGEQGTIKNITASVEYRVAGSNALFVKDSSFTVTLSEAPISLIVDAPEMIGSNQEYNLSIKTTLNADSTNKNMVLVLAYPPGFSYTAASQNPMVGNTVFDLGDLRQGVPKTITIKGSLVGLDKEERSFQIYVGEQNKDNQASIGVIYNSLLQNVMITRPFLDAHLTIDGEDKPVYSVSGSTPINAKIVWSNNAITRIANAQVTMQFEGQALDKDSVIVPNGRYDARNNLIVWDQDTTPEFASLEPGATGELPFTFTAKNISGTSSNSDIQMNVGIRGEQSGDGLGQQTISSVDKKILRFGVDFQIAQSASFLQGPFKNSGTNPPKKGAETTYTINWTLSPVQNVVTGAVAKAVLPIGVRWVGKTSPELERVSFNQNTREITWDIGTVKRSTSNLVRQVSFQVGVTPSAFDTETTTLLMGEINVTGTDTYTGSIVKNTKRELNTRIVDGKSVN